ncbi:MAG: M15 family peptidase, partial [Fusobacterium periodonticum]|nr:M15 family peptidase [Fusobacterium periodonticum]
MYKFSERSKSKLETVDIRLQNLMNVAIKESPYDFSITEGIRTMKRQIELVAQGKSKTLKSYHLKGKAVDIAVWIDGKITWDFKYYKEVADCIKRVARK